MADLTALPAALRRYTEAIARSRLTIYDKVQVGDPDLWIPSTELEAILNDRVAGLDLKDLPLRTRSKVIKTAICTALGYPIPRSFRKTQPRFPGQDFDTYGQKANNLQVWNEELAPTRRYVILRISEADRVTRVRVVTGDTLAKLDTTGTLTQKYQARLNIGAKTLELVTEVDTNNLTKIGLKGRTITPETSPTGHPTAASLIPIGVLFRQLSAVVGQSFEDSGRDQERNRGAALHKLVCRAIGYSTYGDDGQFPDVRNQLLEVKLQTSPTIDLGLVRPDSEDAIDVPQIAGKQIRHCDVRYAIFCGNTDGRRVTLSHLILTTGESFFTRFSQFGGKVLNRKLQIPLPSSFFG